MSNLLVACFGAKEESEILDLMFGVIAVSLRLEIGFDKFLLPDAIFSTEETDFVSYGLGIFMIWPNLKSPVKSKLLIGVSGIKSFELISICACVDSGSYLGCFYFSSSSSFCSS